MYLDTDIILALVKDEDWLKEYVRLAQLQPAQTSVLTIIEARIVLQREYSRKETLALLSKVKKLKIQLLPLDSSIIEKSQELLEYYPSLTNFDAVHAACALVHHETLVSTDSIYIRISGLARKDPREM